MLTNKRPAGRPQKLGPQTPNPENQNVAFFRMEIANAKEINQALRKMGSDPELTRLLRDANRDAADLVAAEAQKRIPVGTKPKRVKRLHQTARGVSSRTAAGGQGRRQKTVLRLDETPRIPPRWGAHQS